MERMRYKQTRSSHKTRTRGEAAISAEKGEKADARSFRHKNPPRNLGVMGLGQARDGPNSNRADRRKWIKRRKLRARGCMRRISQSE